MQLLILTNRGTCKSFKSLNEEIKLSSRRLQTTQKPNYKQVAAIEIRGKYVKSKNIIDDDVIGCMKDQLSLRMQTIQKQPEYHTCLNIYAHDGTFGLIPTGFVPMEIKKAMIRAPQLVDILQDYLSIHTECAAIKLRVCFSGCTFEQVAYGELVKIGLQRLMFSSKILQREIVVHASNGWSILAKRPDNVWVHRVLPATQDLFHIVLNTGGVDNELVFKHAMGSEEGKPKWIATKI
ncbi:hypothetical protein AKO1_014704 [Acrasis kona]|uniref:Uncharacterized protein n=1 Tax=Acrasis kona TaxID=1008807 RepID=A0AAW2Z285_9EUKA